MGRPMGPTRSRLLAWLPVVAALLAIPILMLTLDPVVARRTVPVMKTAAVERYLDFADPLGRWPLGVGVGALLLGLAAARRSMAWARAGVIVLAAVTLSLAVYIPKCAVRRPRPWAAAEGLTWSQTVRDWKWGLNGQAQSFPSGDVTCAAALATACFLAARRGRVRYLLFLIPLASTAGRILGGKHYPSDCLAGFLLGLAVAALAWRLWPDPENRGSSSPSLSSESQG